jgi:hypothetical protein
LQPELLAATKFIAHLVNQVVAHELVALELLTVLLKNPTDDSVEVHSLDLMYFLTFFILLTINNLLISGICVCLSMIGGCGVCQRAWGNAVGLVSSRASW